ncbi:MAG: VWA domain-containing protein [Pseudomonadales bacterium]|nr:VWA domain-containing protein [Pseudomonadales bacterium]
MRLFKSILVCCLLLTGLLAACSQQPQEVMRVLAGSELKDLKPYLNDIRRNTGVQLEFEYIGTLDGADRLIHDKSFDLAWFSHGKYIALTQEQVKTQPIVAQDKIMLSPVVLGVKQSVAKRLGWDDKARLTWRDIADKSAQGEFQFMMTDATASNSGFSAFFGLLAAFSPNPANPDFSNVDKALVNSFFKGNTGRSGSSGWLAERYVKEQTRFDGLVNYESVLLSMNQSGNLNEKLALLYPTEGIVTADYPLMLLKKEKREQYQKLVDYLKSPEFQTIVQEKTFRRPVNRMVKLDPLFNTGLIELPFPSTLDVIDGALFMFLDEHRPPSASVFVLDVSGSMSGERIDQLRDAVKNLTGLDRSVAGKFARFRARESITLIPFSSKIKPKSEFVVKDVSEAGQDMAAIRQKVDTLNAGGGTAIYDALLDAYNDINNKYTLDKERYYTIVLMTDGASNNGANYQDWKQWWRSAPEHLQQVRVFPILFGNANSQEMKGIAETTGGRTFDARKHSLAQVFKKIRGYQ